MGWYRDYMVRRQAMLDRMQARVDRRREISDRLESSASPAPVRSAATTPGSSPVKYETRVERFRTAKDSERRLRRLGRDGWAVVGTEKATWMTTSKPYSVTLQRPRP